MRVLIVEDEYYLANDLAEEFRARGAQVIGPIGTVEEAFRAIEDGSIDCAVLDVNLRGEVSFPIADRFDAEAIPYVITTGYSEESLPERFRSKTRLEKPFRPELLARILAL